ncbi:Chain_A [Hexamita inflata]|uniref:Rab Family Protein n=1 Tax=Hexamita inflata TaxID=28002 RepID=A0AA86V1V1_9EUKA|nr:Chain A [Hexamita inflata]
MNDQMQLIKKYKQYIELKSLKITNVDFQSFKFVQELDVERLRILYSCNIKFTHVPNNITQLQIESCKLVNINGIGQMTQLLDLDLSSNSIVEISDIQYLNQLKTLKINYNQIENILPLQNLMSLTQLSLYQNRIVDISALKCLKNLDKLNLGQNLISSIHHLRQLNLSELHISKNQITDIGSLRNLTYYFKLNLSFNQIVDISVLQHLQKLEHLYLSNNQIVYINSISKLNNIKELQLNCNNISDFSHIPEFLNKSYRACRIEYQQMPTDNQKVIANKLQSIYQVQNCIYMLYNPRQEIKDEILLMKQKIQNQCQKLNKNYLKFSEKIACMYSQLNQVIEMTSQ